MFKQRGRDERGDTGGGGIRKVKPGKETENMMNSISSCFGDSFVDPSCLMLLFHLSHFFPSTSITVDLNIPLHYSTVAAPSD